VGGRFTADASSSLLAAAALFAVALCSCAAVRAGFAEAFCAAPAAFTMQAKASSNKPLSLRKILCPRLAVPFISASTFRSCASRSVNQL
jgi:hypothetical protein